MLSSCSGYPRAPRDHLLKPNMQRSEAGNLSSLILHTRNLRSAVSGSSHTARKWQSQDSNQCLSAFRAQSGAPSKWLVGCGRHTSTFSHPKSADLKAIKQQEPECSLESARWPRGLQAQCLWADAAIWWLCSVIAVLTGWAGSVELRFLLTRCLLDPQAGHMDPGR